jgi:hypothetical protein
MRQRAAIFLVPGALMLLASLYALGGVLQAASLFVGARALRNGNFWGSIALVTFISAIACFWMAGGHNRIPSCAFRRLTGGLLLALAWIVIWPLLAQFVAIDGCLDAGGSYDYINSVCDFTENHEYFPVFDRQGFRIVGFLVFSVLGILALAIDPMRRKGSNAL